jgi:hypothetical protein
MDVHLAEQPRSGVDELVRHIGRHNHDLNELLAQTILGSSPITNIMAKACLQGAIVAS